MGKEAGRTVTGNTYGPVTTHLTITTEFPGCRAHNTNQNKQKFSDVL